MSHALSFAEIDGQYVELLPARTVLSMFRLDGGDDTVIADACQSTHTSATPGLVGLLGLGAAAQDTETCQPAAVVDNHGE